MTTKVTVEPAGHAVRVIVTEGGKAADPVILQPGSKPADFWVWTGNKILVEEVEGEVAP